MPAPPIACPGEEANGEIVKNNVFAHSPHFRRQSLQSGSLYIPPATEDTQPEGPPAQAGVRRPTDAAAALALAEGGRQDRELGDAAHRPAMSLDGADRGGRNARGKAAAGRKALLQGGALHGHAIHPVVGRGARAAHGRAQQPALPVVHQLVLRRRTGRSGAVRPCLDHPGSYQSLDLGPQRAVDVAVRDGPLHAFPLQRPVHQQVQQDGVHVETAVTVDRRALLRRLSLHRRAVLARRPESGGGGRPASAAVGRADPLHDAVDALPVERRRVDAVEGGYVGEIDSGIPGELQNGDVERLPPAPAKLHEAPALVGTVHQIQLRPRAVHVQAVHGDVPALPQGVQLRKQRDACTHRVVAVQADLVGVGHGLVEADSKRSEVHLDVAQLPARVADDDVEPARRAELDKAVHEHTVAQLTHELAAPAAVEGVDLDRVGQQHRHKGGVSVVQNLVVDHHVVQGEHGRLAAVVDGKPFAEYVQVASLQDEPVQRGQNGKGKVQLVVSPRPMFRPVRLLAV